jgi:D-glycero-alpha-D-manno-heptose-7-phosphate kinase
MIISRTPVRISFFGGLTDLKEFYSKSYGAVLSTAIRKYIYVAINKKFDDKIKVSHIETEVVDSLDGIKHPIMRECLRAKGISNGIEISAISDMPNYGIGLGSSSSLTVGTLNALGSYVGHKEVPEVLADEACKIEIDTLKRQAGKQDPYITAVGGFRYIKFYPDEKVSIETVSMSDTTIKDLKDSLITFYIAGRRDGDEIIGDQKKNLLKNIKTLEEMRDQAEIGMNLLKKGDINSFGGLLDKAWKLKRSLSSKISTSAIDSYYSLGIKAGALGGKVGGAGGAGFLTFFCEKERQEKLKESLSMLKAMDVAFEDGGTRIVYDDTH